MNYWDLISSPVNRATGNSYVVARCLVFSTLYNSHTGVGCHLYCSTENQDESSHVLKNNQLHIYLTHNLTQTSVS